jgi:hypothetical protein
MLFRRGKFAKRGGLLALATLSQCNNVAACPPAVPQPTYPELGPIGSGSGEPATVPPAIHVLSAAQTYPLIVQTVAAGGTINRTGTEGSCTTSDTHTQSAEANSVKLVLHTDDKHTKSCPAAGGHTTVSSHEEALQFTLNMGDIKHMEPSRRDPNGSLFGLVNLSYSANCNAFAVYDRNSVNNAFHDTRGFSDIVVLKFDSKASADKAQVLFCHLVGLARGSVYSCGGTW